MASQTNDNIDSARWLLVSRRDLSANSSFFYGVKSTQIFCRPTCPGRVARRGNIIFFDDLQHASQSGYRPCKRCEPCNDDWSRDSSGRKIAQHAHAMIVAAEAHSLKWTVGGLARKLGVASAHLHRQFKKWFLMTPKAFAESLGRPERSLMGYSGLDRQVPSSDYRLPETFTDLGEYFPPDDLVSNLLTWSADDVDSFEALGPTIDTGS
ncbi:hypothetical protein HER10_EVM0007352 [Colletotrichum scovillei]|uniref:uncharacterized protein n=1 Tax=Colletotrichum scovillei TaxID=1209932 RepID=UPI0015C3EE35|nr:uncharacterized protein HER10_EVM0007352 [Colletotrichum scovillei]KAF4784352.1 hypothetical protein HER10_EVM0007352 [Colletotrichum scovillei]